MALKVSTKKSLSPPIEIELDGIVYTANVSAENLIKARKLEEKAITGDFNAIAEQLEIILPGIKKEKLLKLDVRDLERVLYFIAEETKKPPDEAEKNASTSGSKKPDRSPMPSPDSSPSTRSGK